MIEEQGRVVALTGDRAWVQTLSQSACQSCKVRAGCGQKLMADMTGAKVRQICIDNPVHARVGDEVRLGIEESALLRASVLVYLVPVLALLGGALVGDRLMALGDIGTAVVAVVAMAICFGLSRMAQRSAFSGRFTPLLLGVQEAGLPRENASDEGK